MPEADTIDRATIAQGAGRQPAAGRQRPRLCPPARQMMKALGVDEGDVIEIVGKRSTAAIARPPLWRGRRHRHHPPRRPPARQCRGRLGRLRRGSQGDIQAGHQGRVRAGPAQHPAAGLGRSLEAHLRAPAADRGRRRRHRRSPAGQRRHARRRSPDAQRARLRASGAAPGRRHRPSPRASSTSTARPWSSCFPNIPRRTANGAPTSLTTTWAGCATRSTRCAKWSSFRCATPSCSSGSGSIRPRACCFTARRAPARRCSRAQSPTKARRASSTSTARKSWARPMARASAGCAKCSSRRPSRRRRSSSSTRSIRSRPSASRSPARRRSGWSPSC